MTIVAMRGRLTDPPAILDFVLAGKAVFTLVSERTGNRFTYRVAQCADNELLFFVSLLTGPDNMSDYRYLGTIRREHDGVLYRHGHGKSQVGIDAPSVLALIFFVRWVLSQGTVPDGLQCYHEGRCGRCGRRLTVPESLDRGLGPECARM